MKIIKLAVVFALLVLLLAACGSNEDPKMLASAIAKAYNKAMIKLADIIKDKPDADQIRGEVESHKEETIKEMVALGKRLAAMDKKGRSQVNIALMREIGALQNELAFKTAWQVMNDVQMHYSKQGKYKLSNLISSFNIITQYAQFDLLKKQNPKEAERLKIK